MAILSVAVPYTLLLGVGEPLLLLLSTAYLGGAALTNALWTYGLKAQTGGPPTAKRKHGFRRNSGTTRVKFFF